MEFDLNSPESDPKEYGCDPRSCILAGVSALETCLSRVSLSLRSPYPVNRAVAGLRGNAAWLMKNDASTIRGGILMHTGEWANYSDWQPPLPMPNSLGCIHAW